MCQIGQPCTGSHPYNGHDGYVSNENGGCIEPEKQPPARGASSYLWVWRDEMKTYSVFFGT